MKYGSYDADEQCALWGLLVDGIGGGGRVGKEIAWKGKSFWGLGENICKWSFALLLARHLDREGSRAENCRLALMAEALVACIYGFATGINVHEVIYISL